MNTQQWDECLKDLETLASVGRNWDGDGGKAPLPQSVNFARGQLRRLQEEEAKPPDALGLLDGEVVATWLGEPFIGEMVFQANLRIRYSLAGAGAGFPRIEKVE